jgi:two-component system, NtrC family, nitrogen regulation response regulator NtrX
MSELVDVAILDDDLDFRNYLEDLLKDEGEYQVRAFAKAAELLAASELQVPEVVLLDMKMGSDHGLHVAETILTRWPAVCVIVITGYPSLEDMRTTFKLKVFDYLSKPFSLAQLRQTLRNAIEQFGLGRSAHAKFREKLGHRVKMLRTEKDWSLKDLAAATRLSMSQISSIERGINMPSVESLLAISRAFDRKPSELLASIEF